MEHQLTQFFVKHPMEFSVMTAVKLIDKHVDKAKDCLKDNKDSKEYLKYLKEAAVMITDLFAELGEDHNNY